jgi:hypothetical protein
MLRLRPAWLHVLGLVALTACVRDVPQPQAIVIQQPATQVVPGPPPEPPAELVPTPPTDAGPVVWQPGHWQFTGSSGNAWAWKPGQYVPPPPGQTTWVRGQWAQQPSGGWAWIEGHWS